MAKLAQSNIEVRLKMYGTFVKVKETKYAYWFAHTFTGKIVSIPKNEVEA